MSPPLKYKTPQEQRCKEMASIVRGVLAGDYWDLGIDELSIEENLREKSTKIACLVHLNKENFTIEEVGRGPIDALFNGLKNNFKKSYLSFHGLNFYEFSISGDVGDSSLNMASEVECTLSITSVNIHKPLIYRCRDASINRAAVCVVLAAVEYYINSERAMKILRECVKDAQERGRGDLLEESVLKMSKLLEGVSYKDALATIKNMQEKED
tara:strand:+ start:3527 stop:4162 length:636 start_codon:yes stop_codon:yes gene_type:complete